MDPIALGLMASSLVSGGGSIAAGLMNTSSAQAINAAQLQFQQQQLGYQQQVSKGAFLPQYMSNLVSAANQAGISPLAALGVQSPSFTVRAAPLESTSMGPSVANAANALSQIVDPHNVAMMRLQEQLGVAQIQKMNAETSQAKVDAARGAMINDMLTQGGAILNQIKGGLDRFSQDYKAATSISWPSVGSALSGMGQGTLDWLLKGALSTSEGG